MNSPSTSPSVLSIDPTNRGFAYAHLSLAGTLLDSRHVEIRPTDNKAVLLRFGFLLRQLKPMVVVLEDCSAPGCRRRERIRDLSADLTLAAQGQGVRVALIPATSMRRAILGSKYASKLELTAVISDLFPEKRAALPSASKMQLGSASVSTAVLDSLCFALAYLRGQTTSKEVA